MSQKAFKDPVELAERVEAYFAKCEASKDVRELKNGDIKIRRELPSFVGLAVFLGVAQPTLRLYADGKYDSQQDGIQDNEQNERYNERYTETYSAVLARARDRMELAVVEAASNGDTDSRITLARLAKFGYSTKVETESKATLTVQWEGARLDDVKEWGC